MYYVIPLEMLISGKEGIMEEYYPIVFFLRNSTGIMLSPILNNVRVSIPKYAPTGSHSKGHTQKCDLVSMQEER